MAIEQGFAGIGQVAQGVGDLAPLYGRSMNDKRAQALVYDSDFLKGMGYNPADIKQDQRLGLLDQISSTDISGKAYRQGMRANFQDFDFSIFN